MTKKYKVLDVMLEILNQHQEGILSGEFVAEVRNKTEVSSVKVYEYVKELEKSGCLKKVPDKADARKVWYFPIMDKVKELNLDVRRFIEEKEKKETDVIGVVIPKTMRKILQRHIERNMYLNLSDFVREAIREKLQREAPDLYKQLFKHEGGENA